MRHTAPYAIGAFAVCAVLALLLPRTAVGDEALLGAAGRAGQASSVRTGA